MFSNGISNHPLNHASCKLLPSHTQLSPNEVSPLSVSNSMSQPRIKLVALVTQQCKNLQNRPVLVRSCPSCITNIPASSSPRTREGLYLCKGAQEMILVNVSRSFFPLYEIIFSQLVQSRGKNHPSLTLKRRCTRRTENAGGVGDPS